MTRKHPRSLATTSSWEATLFAAIPFGAILLAAIPLSLLGGCSRNETPPPPPCPSAMAGTPVDPTLMAFLSRARSAHHSADRHEDQQRIAQAIGVLEELVGGPIPGLKTTSKPAETAPRGRVSEAALAPEVREVLADTQARLADLKSREQDFAGAEQHLERGLELVPEQGYFRGHLFEVRGLVAERHAKQSREGGDERRARELEQRALQAFEQAMQIQAEVIDEAVGGDAARSGDAAVDSDNAP